jgi:hypothetical protein
MRQVMKRLPDPLSGGRISGERVPAADCQCEHKRFSGLKCLYWQRDWGDVPKAITEATVARPGTAKHKTKATPKTAATAKPKAAAKKAGKRKKGMQMT